MVAERRSSLLEEVPAKLPCPGDCVREKFCSVDVDEWRDSSSAPEKEDDETDLGDGNGTRGELSNKRGDVEPL